jgi:hypothetical protein
MAYLVAVNSEYLSCWSVFSLGHWALVTNYLMSFFILPLGVPSSFRFWLLSLASGLCDSEATAQCGIAIFIHIGGYSA